MNSLENDPNSGQYHRIRQVLDALLAHGLPLTMTLNELRVLNTMTLCFIEHSPVTQSEIVGITGLSKTTVSRYVLNWLNLGWLSESIDVTDRRRRPLSLTEFAIDNSKSLTNELAAII